MLKGISQLITAILLIGITVMIAGVMANWLFKLSVGQAGIIEAKGGEIRCHFAGLAVSNVSYNCNTGKLSLNAKNTGDKTLTDFKFMIILENASVVTNQVEGILSPQESMEFSVQAPNALNYTKLIFLSQTCPTIVRVDISPSGIKLTEPELCGLPAVVYLLSVSAEPEIVEYTSNSEITAYLTDSAGAQVEGQGIEFKITKGVGTLSSANVITNESGVANTTFTPNPEWVKEVEITANCSELNTNGSITLTVAYPCPNTWTITDRRLCRDKIITLSGNLVVKSSGKLYFDNVTLKMNSSFNGEYAINVTEGITENGSFIVSNSNITANNISNKYNFTNYGYLELENSNVSYSNGVMIFSSGNMIKNNSMFNSSYGIYLLNSSNNITWNTICNNEIDVYCRASTGEWEENKCDKIDSDCGIICKPCG